VERCCQYPPIQPAILPHLIGWQAPRPLDTCHGNQRKPPEEEQLQSQSRHLPSCQRSGVGGRTVNGSRSLSAIVYFRGNSDPFDTYTIKICPRVNAILKFYRDDAIPSQYHTGPDGWKTTKAAIIDWQDAIRSLNDKGGALGFLARWAQVASNVSGSSDLGLQALRYRSQSTTILREKLKDEGGSISKSTYWHIHTLYTAETLAGNVQGAWLHALLLRRVLEQQSQAGNMDLTYLRYFLYNESQACCMFMTRPVLDYEMWVPEMFKASWHQAADELPYLDTVRSRKLDPAIDSSFLRKIFVLQREDLAVWREASHRSEGLSPILFTWFASRHSMHQVRLVTYALDSMDAARRATAAGRSEFLYKEAYLALAVIYWTRLIAGNDCIRGVEIFDTKKPILNLMGCLLDRHRVEFELSGSSKYANARLWALYLGAQAEHHHQHSGTRDTDPAKGWFSTQFSLQAIRMGLSRWESVRDVLDGFLDGDLVEPHGAQFVPRLIRP